MCARDRSLWLPRTDSTEDTADTQWLWAPSVLKFLSEVHPAPAASVAKPQEYQPASGHSSSTFLLFLPSSPRPIPCSCHPCSLADTQQASTLRPQCWRLGSACFHFLYFPFSAGNVWSEQGESAQSGGSREWILMTSWRQRMWGRTLYIHLPPPPHTHTLLRSSPPPSRLSFTYRLSARSRPVFTGFVSHWLWLISRWRRVEEPNVAVLKTETGKRQTPTAVCRTSCTADRRLHSRRSCASPT